eukprot:5939054-Amphidinium_carterae.1
MLATLAKLLKECTTSYSELASDFRYSLGNPLQLRQTLEGTGTPNAAKSASWSQEARAVMKTGCDCVNMFRSWNGFSLGAIASALPELAIVILLLDSNRPCVAMLNLPLSDELRSDIELKAEGTIGSNRKGTESAKQVKPLKCQTQSQRTMAPPRCPSAYHARARHVQTRQWFTNTLLGVVIEL